MRCYDAGSTGPGGEGEAVDAPAQVGGGQGTTHDGPRRNVGAATYARCMYTQLITRYLYPSLSMSIITLFNAEW